VAICAGDGEERRTRIVEDLAVGESQDLVPEIFEMGIPVFVTSHLFPGSMDAAINFDHKSCSGTKEVDDEGPDPVLTPKLQAQELAIPEKLPKGLLGRSLALSQLAGEPEELVDSWLSVHGPDCNGGLPEPSPPEPSPPTPLPPAPHALPGRGAPPPARWVLLCCRLERRVWMGAPPSPRVEVVGGLGEGGRGGEGCERSEVSRGYRR